MENKTYILIKQGKEEGIYKTKNEVISKVRELGFEEIETIDLINGCPVFFENEMYNLK